MFVEHDLFGEEWTDFNGHRMEARPSNLEPLRDEKRERNYRLPWMASKSRERIRARFTAGAYGGSWLREVRDK